MREFMVHGLMDLMIELSTREKAHVTLQLHEKVLATNKDQALRKTLDRINASAREFNFRHISIEWHALSTALIE